MVLVGILKSNLDIEDKVQELDDSIIFKCKHMPIILIETNNPQKYLSMDEFENIYEERVGRLQSINFIPNLKTDLLKKNAYLAWGTTVAVIDSGINEEIGILKYKDFTDNNDGNDYINHGTTVSSIIKDIAGGVGFINLKITNKLDFKESAIIRALDYVYENSHEIHVVNMSLGISKNNCQGKACAICKMVNIISNLGIIFVAAAGNNGPKNNTVTCPAVSDNVLAVGSVSPNNNSVSNFSSRGKINRFKPDVLAPGIININLECKKELHRDEGTSYSAPIVSGIASVLVSKFRNAEYVITKIKESTNTLKDVPTNHQGFGVINIDKILEVCQNDIGCADIKQQG